MARLVRDLVDTLGVLVVWDRSIGSCAPSPGSVLMMVRVGELGGDTEDDDDEDVEHPKSGRRMFSMENESLEEEETLESGDPQLRGETLLSRTWL